MTAVPSHTEAPGPAEDQSRSDDKAVMFDLSQVDVANVHADRAEIDRWIPHRDKMALLDRVAWVSQDQTCAVGVHHACHDAFWVPGHFPDRAMMPGVLMIEAGAQLACYLYRFRRGESAIAALLRIDNAVFRRAVEPGQDLMLLCRDVKVGARRFISDIQGVVEGQVIFSARITGMNVSEPQPTEK